MNKQPNWKATVGQRVRRLTPDQAEQYLARIREAGVTIHQPAVRELTGGYSSQAISFYVQRKLAERAGWIKKIS